MGFAVKKYVSICVSQKYQCNEKNKDILIVTVITIRQQKQALPLSSRCKKDVVSCLEYKSKCPCLQAVKSCNNSCGCIGCENPFGKSQGEDPPDVSSVKRLRRKHSLTTEAAMKYLQIDHKKAHWSVIEELLLE